MQLSHQIIELHRIRVSRADDGDTAFCSRFHEFVSSGQYREAAVGAGEVEQHEGAFSGVLAATRLGFSGFDPEICRDSGIDLFSEGVAGGSDFELIDAVGLFFHPARERLPAELICLRHGGGYHVKGHLDFQILFPRFVYAGVVVRHHLCQCQHQEEELQRRLFEDVFKERCHDSQHFDGGIPLENAQKALYRLEFEIDEFHSFVAVVVLALVDLEAGYFLGFGV